MQKEDSCARNLWRISSEFTDSADHMPKRTRAMEILVVEDDIVFREEVLTPRLSDAGFKVLRATNIREMYRELLVTEPSLVLMDVSLPDESGFSALKHLKRVGKYPIIMLADRYSLDDLFLGLENGADAYLPKSVDATSLIATLHSSIIRHGRFASRINTTDIEHAASQNPGMGWHLDHISWQMLSPKGIRIWLNSAERIIVQHLWSSQGKPVRREVLIESLTADMKGFDPHRLEVVVHRLRKKVVDLAGEHLPITTLRNIGYAMSPND
ncbi:response regulator transcription factor [Stenotrophomonas humi]|nr:response regulator transcription factor [Stenotrophomonas humi]